MFKTKEVICVFILSICVLLLSACDNPENSEVKSSESVAISNDWIIGNWGLAYDPDGNEKDYMEFLPDGRFLTKIPDGRTFEGNYSFEDNKVILKLKVKAKEISFPMEISEDNTKLTNESGAYYSKE